MLLQLGAATLQAIPSSGEETFSLEEANTSSSAAEQIRRQQQLRAATAGRSASSAPAARAKDGMSTAVDETFFSSYDDDASARNDAIETPALSGSAAANPASAASAAAADNIEEEFAESAAVGHMSLVRGNVKVQPTFSDRSAEVIHEKALSSQAPPDTSKTWKSVLTENFSKLRVPLITQYNSRLEIIDRKIKFFLASPEDQDSKRSTLLSLCERAKAYHGACMSQLTSNKAAVAFWEGRLKKKDTSKMGSASKLILDLGSIQKLNARPNKVEQIMTRVEAAFQKLEECQTRLSEVETKINDLQGNEMSPELASFIEAKGFLNTAISRYRDLIEAEKNLAQCITLPFETEKNEAHIANERNRNIQHIASLKAYFQAVHILYASVNNFSRARYIRRAINTLDYAALEAQKAAPNELVIDRFFNPQSFTSRLLQSVMMIKPNKEKPMQSISIMRVILFIKPL
ncbi:MAG: hypothetical protein FJ390_00040 [Verrucomicrobia bacterium]|nr:hypothetical protein [Verrucomicrobiota bacterium]